MRPMHTDKKKTRRIIKYSVIALVILAIFGGGLWVYNQVSDLYDRVNRIEEISRELLTEVDNSEIDFDHVRALVLEGNDLSNGVQAQIKPYYSILRNLGSIPSIGKYALLVEPAVEAVVHTYSAGQKAIDLVYPVTQNPLIENKKSILISQIIENQDAIASILEDIAAIERAIDSLDVTLLPASYQVKIETGRQLLPLASEGIQVLQLIPELTGAEKPVTYLILVQNSDELRATGGFISLIGLLRLDQGEITYLDFDDVSGMNYISKYVKAPDPMEKILPAYYWLPRDGNWSPSFPESARTVQELYYLSTGVKSDGVFAIDQRTIEMVLDFTGSVTVNEKDITGENVREYMVQEKMDAIMAGNSKSRKSFVGPLFENVFDRIIEKANNTSPRTLLSFFTELASKGDLLIFFNNSQLEELTVKYHLSGDLRPGSGDYLMLVDSNIGINKADYAMERSMKYSVNLEDVIHPSSKVNIIYHNPMEGAVICKQAGDIREPTEVAYLLPSCYWNYYRVLGSSGTTISDYELYDFDDRYFYEGYGWTHQPDFGSITDSVSYAGALLVLPPSSDATITFNRSLPQSSLINNNGQYTYTLVVQKQPGIRSLPLEIEVILPQYSEMISVTTDFPYEFTENQLLLRGNLTESYTIFTINFKLQ